mmetsp:Transcript_15907/g.38513  ORF Transcript_15907/g.38513 Transcript_15907/m.38513 type:complete len:224 (+) Transcript_15907:418-1089(+)
MASGLERGLGRRREPCRWREPRRRKAAHWRRDPRRRRALDRQPRSLRVRQGRLHWTCRQGLLRSRGSPCRMTNAGLEAGVVMPARVRTGQSIFQALMILEDPHRCPAQVFPGRSGREEPRLSTAQARSGTQPRRESARGRCVVVATASGRRSWSPGETAVGRVSQFLPQCDCVWRRYVTVARIHTPRCLSPGCFVEAPGQQRPLLSSQQPQICDSTRVSLGGA